MRDCDRLVSHIGFFRSEYKIRVACVSLYWKVSFDLDVFKHRFDVLQEANGHLLLLLRGDFHGWQGLDPIPYPKKMRLD